MGDNHNEPRIHDAWFLDLDFLLYAPLVDDPSVRNLQKTARLGRVYGADDETIWKHVAQGAASLRADETLAQILDANPWIHRIHEERREAEALAGLPQVEPVVVAARADKQPLDRDVLAEVIALAGKHGRAIRLLLDGGVMIEVRETDAARDVFRRGLQAMHPEGDPVVSTLNSLRRVAKSVRDAAERKDYEVATDRLLAAHRLFVSLSTVVSDDELHEAREVMEQLDFYAANWPHIGG